MDLIHVHTHICTFGGCLLRPPKQGWPQFIILEVSLSFFWVMVFSLKAKPQKYGEKHKGVQKALWIVNALLRPYKQGAWFFHPPKNQQGPSKSLNVIHGLDLHSRSEDLCKLSGAKIKYSNSNNNFKNLFSADFLYRFQSWMLEKSTGVLTHTYFPQACLAQAAQNTDAAVCE